jgi:RNA-directed DNA polymerase
VNTDAPWPDPDGARPRVRVMQAKLHRWALEAPDRKFDDVYNLVYDRDFLTVAWEKVRTNKGARTAGVDGVAPRALSGHAVGMLEGLRQDLKAREFSPSPVRQKTIPKASGKVRSLGIPTARDRVVQAALKLVMEPIFEADFLPGSYGFRPNRRAQDAIAEIQHFASHSCDYEWVFEADIKACFDEIDHVALMDRVRNRVGDKRVLALVKAFLKAGILSEDGFNRDTDTGTPQGGILSPLLANIALSVLDEHFDARWKSHGSQYQRVKHQRNGGSTMKLVKYADDFVIMVRGNQNHAEGLWDEVGQVLAPMGLRLSVEKTRVVHIDEGLDFLGWHIQRRPWQGRAGKTVVYTYPSKKSLNSIIGKVRDLTQRPKHRTLEDLLRQLNPVLRGWSNYFRHPVSSRTLSYVGKYAFGRVLRWMRKRHPKLSVSTLRRRYFPDWKIRSGGIELLNPGRLKIEPYRYRGAKIPTPWTSTVSRLQTTTA